jgi:3-oxoacyl-[acyl-carrier protein] reductase
LSIGVDELPVMAVTGTSKGLGLGIVKYFAGRGYRVAGCSRGSAGFESENYIHFDVDVGDEKQVRSWIRSIKRAYGRLDVLVCNAGLAPAALLMLETPAELLESVLRTNVTGTYNVCREAAKVMLLRRFGRIITVSSMAVGLHEEGTSAYSASKSAVVEMTKIMAKELVTFGITCNVMAPSMYITGAVNALGEAVIARALDKLTIKRTLTIEEICNVISFFASPESSSITGQVLHMGLVN